MCKCSFIYPDVFCFSASGAGQGSIDHRIEQAMVSCSLSQGLYFDPPRILLLISVHRTRSGNVCVSGPCQVAPDECCQIGGGGAQGQDFKAGGEFKCG